MAQPRDREVFDLRRKFMARADKASITVTSISTGAFLACWAQKCRSSSGADIVATMSEASGERYRRLWAGSLGSLGVMIRIAKLIAPPPAATFPAWQGMQYMRDEFSGRARLTPLDNARYAGLVRTSVHGHLATLDWVRA